MRYYELFNFVDHKLLTSRHQKSYRYVYEVCQITNLKMEKGFGYTPHLQIVFL